MNWVVSPLTTRTGALRDCTKWKAFIETRWGKEAISKRKDYFYASSSFGGKRMQVFYHADCLFFLWSGEMERAYLIGVDQQIPD